MTPSPRQLAVVAAAGSHKTEYIVNQALAYSDRRVLLTTYTLNNLACIQQRIYQKVGHLPAHITLMSWYGFLMHHWCRPYQRAILGAPGVIRGVDFKSQRPRWVGEANARQYFCTPAGHLYKDRVADFAVKVNAAADGAAVRRLQELYEEVYIDEVQDLAYYDLGILEGLLHSGMHVIAVGDLRQHTYATNQNTKDKKYRGASIADWLSNYSDVCDIEYRTTSYRCNQEICDFADALYPNLPATTSANLDVVTPSGILMIKKADLPAHISAHNPIVLRHDMRTRTFGVPAINFGAAKGMTAEHVVIFTTGDIRRYLETKNPEVLKGVTRSKLYVAITRARHSVAFVSPG